MKYLLAFACAFTIGIMYNSLSVVESVNPAPEMEHRVCRKPVATFDCDMTGKCKQIMTNPVEGCN
jgi:hypothetical protein